MIRFIKRYEADKPKQHPVGMTILYPGGTNADLSRARRIGFRQTQSSWIQSMTPNANLPAGQWG